MKIALTLDCPFLRLLRVSCVLDADICGDVVVNVDQIYNNADEPEVVEDMCWEEGIIDAAFCCVVLL